MHPRLDCYTREPVVKNVSKCHVIDENILNNSDHLAVKADLSIEVIRCLGTKSKASRIKWGEMSQAALRDNYFDPSETLCHDILEDIIINEATSDMLDEVIDRLTLTNISS